MREKYTRSAAGYKSALPGLNCTGCEFRQGEQCQLVQGGGAHYGMCRYWVDSNARERYGSAWDESKHPRGQSENSGQFAGKEGAAVKKLESFQRALDKGAGIGA